MATDSEVAMLTQRVEALGTSVSKLTEGIGALETKTRISKTTTDRIRRNERRFIKIVAFDLVITVAGLFGGYFIHKNADKANNAAHLANSAALVAKATADQAVCKTLNAANDEQLKLWIPLFNLQPATSQTPQQKAQTALLRQRFQQTFAPTNCAGSVLGPYPTQMVTNRVAGIAGPAMHYGEVAVITGELCSSAKTPVPVLTTLSWQAVGHTGTFVQVASGIHQTRQPGCQTFTGANAFHNPMPAEVVKATETLGGRAQWVVTGYEIPILAGGVQGSQQDFTSQPFWVVK